MASSSGSNSKNSKSAFEMYNCCKDGILKIEDNLDDIYGTFSKEKQFNMNLLYKHISRLFDELILETENDKKAVKKNIDELLAEKKKLESELNTHISIEEHTPYTPLMTVQIDIETTLQDYRNIKLERINELHKLLEEEQQICQILNMQPKYSESNINFNTSSCITQLKQVKDHVIDLKSIKTERLGTFLEQRANVQSMFIALGDIPILQFDKMVLGDPVKFQLSISNMSELLQLLKRLKDQVENQKSIAMDLRNKLNSLWDILKIDMSYRRNFVKNKNRYDKNVIHQLKLEVLKCEMIKRENTTQCIENLRVELNDLWNKCHFGGNQRKKCHVYFMEKSFNKEYNEYLMELLEIEIDTVKKFYADNSSIYYLIEERNNLWKKMIKLQELTNDPARYWQNRGGQLLKEERDRKIIQRELPRVEQELKSLLHSYEQREGRLFLYNDERLINFIDNQWDEFKNSRQFLRQTKTGVNPGTPLSSSPHSRKNENQTCKVSVIRKQTYSPHQLGMNNKAPRTPGKELSHQNRNVGSLVQLTSTPIIGPNLKFTPQFPTFDEKSFEESYKAFQKYQESKRQLLFTSVSREQNAEQPQSHVMETPIQRSEVPILTTSNTTPNAHAQIPKSQHGNSNKKF